jgi:hypothetical protein
MRQRDIRAYLFDIVHACSSWSNSPPVRPLLTTLPILSAAFIAAEKQKADQQKKELSRFPAVA